MKAGESAHGLLAEFSDPAALLLAARAAHGAGYRKLEAYAPMPVEGLVEALGPVDEPLARLALWGGIVGGSAPSPAMAERHRRLSAEHRRTHAGVARPDSVDLRDDDAGRRTGGVLRRAAAQPLAPALSPGL
jgi:hypothetical protein